MAEIDPAVVSTSEFIIVGIGASAGGIQALIKFFENVSEYSGMAYVVILHLSPDHESQLPEILQQVSRIPVIRVIDKIQVQPNQAYVISPNHHLSMLDGYIQTTPNLDEKDRRAPVDIFFRTLAESNGSKAVSVVLSGTGANGSMGLKRIKERGGAAFVQHPGEAEFSEMPVNSLATGLVDEVLFVADIPAKLESYKDGLSKIRIKIDEKNLDEAHQDALRDIFTQIRTKLGHDFSNYKRPTVLRRIERRLSIRNQSDLVSYARFVENNPEEITALLKDLLISVTNFFRDPATFLTLETKVIPELIKEHADGKPIRIWVAGCATGEEAYSIAMICAEQTMHLIDMPKVQIFATDIDEDAIGRAREGIYTLNDSADVSPERFKRFFTKRGDVYTVNKEIRDMILFATHNVLRDPPFAHLDLISCRNVLIYLNKAAQQRLMETFHFALRPEGYLFLGLSEVLEGAGNIYSVFNREQHIFQSRAVATRNYPVLDFAPAFRYDLVAPIVRKNRKLSENFTYEDLHQQVLNEISPASILINEEFEILHISGSAGRFLQIRSGELSKNLLTLILPEFRLELNAALNQVVQKKRSVEIKDKKVSVGDAEELVTILVRPVFQTNTTQDYILVLFKPIASDAFTEPVISLSDEPGIKELDGEMMRLKAQLKNSLDQDKSRVEELKASNEELQAMNEELRSAAEELETSKEELQSINEELRTVNQELKVKIDETILSNNNLRNLINSSDIGTIFLDKNLNVAFFTPAVKQIFNLIPGDRGRPLSDITHNLEYRDFLKDAAIVMENLQSIEKEVDAKNHNRYLMRLLPYRTSEDRIDGVVINFVDITAKSVAESELRRSREQLQVVTDLVPDLLWSNSPDGVVNWFNHRWIDYTGHKLDSEITQLAFHGWSSVIHPDDFDALRKKWEYAEENGEILEAQFRLKSSEGLYKWHIARSAPLRNPDNKIISWFGAATDIDDLKSAEQALALSEDRFRIAVQSAEMIAWDWDVRSDELIWNEDNTSFSKNTATEKKDMMLEKFVHPEDRKPLLNLLNSVVKNGRNFQAEFRVITPDIKDEQWYFAFGKPVSSENGTTNRMAGVIYNITKRKIRENQKDEFLGIASHELKTPVTSIRAYADVLQEIVLEFKEPQAAALIEKLLKQVDRLTDLINSLLDTTRIFEGQLSLNKSDFQINELIRERAEEMQRLTKHTIVLKLNEDIPTVNADINRIQQVLTNLISNAIKYSPGDGEIIVSTEKTDKNVKVSVRDFGIGIPDSLKTRVFDRFFRVKNPSIRSFPGMGLGLYIVAGIIRQHGGRILVVEDEEPGTLIYFTLPLAGSTNKDQL